MDQIVPLLQRPRPNPRLPRLVHPQPLHRRRPRSRGRPTPRPRLWLDLRPRPSLGLGRSTLGDDTGHRRLLLFFFYLLPPISIALLRCPLLPPHAVTRPLRLRPASAEGRAGGRRGRGRLDLPVPKSSMRG